MSALLNRQFLIRNLCFMYRLMVASAPLLQFAIQRSDGKLREYFEKHLAEETGHEEMVEADLADLGVERIPKDYTAAMLAGSQYYLIAHHHPALLLGYMSVLEGSPLPLEHIEEVEKEHGCRMTALRLHSERDPHHSAEIRDLVMSLPEEQREAVFWNAENVRGVLLVEFKKWVDEREVHAD